MPCANSIRGPLTDVNRKLVQHCPFDRRELSSGTGCYARMQRLLAIATISLLATVSSWAADGFTRRINPLPVAVAGDTLQIPFWGGLTNPKPSLLDFNHDGLTDLLLGDTAGRLG